MYIVYYGSTKHYAKKISGIEILSLTPYGLIQTIKAFKG